MRRRAEHGQLRGIRGPGGEHAARGGSVARRHELARAPGRDEVADAADGRREHGQAGRHRFEDRVREALPVADQREGVAIGELGGDVVAVAEQRDAAGQAQLVAVPLDRLAIGAVAEDAQLPALAAGLGERVEQGDEILRRGEPCGAAEHEPLAGRPAIGEDGRRVDAVVDDVQLAARLDVAVVRELQVVVRDAHDRVAERRDCALGRRVQRLPRRRRGPRTPSRAR